MASNQAVDVPAFLWEPMVNHASFCADVTPFSTSSRYRNFSDDALSALHQLLRHISREVEASALRRAYRRQMHAAHALAKTHTFDQEGAVGRHTVLTASSRSDAQDNAAHENEEHLFLYTSEDGSNDTSECDTSIRLDTLTGVERREVEAYLSRPCVQTGLYARYHHFSYAPHWFVLLEPPPHGMAPFCGGKAVVSVALTAEPPEWVAGMLYDPARGRYLFGGTPFREEARVLRVLNTPSRTCPVCPAASTDGRLRQPLLLLLREYFTVCPHRNGYYVVQTCSLVPEGVSAVEYVPRSKHELLSPAATRAVLDATAAGAVTRVFALPRSGDNTHVKHHTAVSAVGVGLAETGHPRSCATAPAPDSLSRDEPHRLNEAGTVRNGSAGGVKGRLGIDVHDEYNAVSGPQNARRADRVGRDTIDASTDTVPMHASSCSSIALPTWYHTIALRDAFFEHWSYEHDARHVHEPANVVRRFLIRLTRHDLVLAQLGRRLWGARKIQHFLRARLESKHRAMRRMLTLWATLEAQTQAELHRYKPPPSSVEREEIVAGSILQRYVVTTNSYKRNLIRTMWQERRVRYRDRLAARREDVQLRRGGGERGGVPCRCARARSSRAGEESRRISSITDILMTHVMQDEEGTTMSGESWARLLQSCSERLDLSQLSASPGMSVSSASDDVSDEEGGDDEGDETHTDCGIARRMSRAEAVHRMEMNERHRCTGWFINPLELLYESQSRLLSSLQMSVLTLEQTAKVSSSTVTPLGEKRGERSKRIE